MAQNVTVEECQGCVLARADGLAETELDGLASVEEHRWWFEKTEQGRLVFVQEVIEHEGGRTALKEHAASVPEQVREALASAGYERLFDTSARPL